MKGKAGGRTASDNPVRNRFQLRHWLWVGLDFLFPPRCVSCGRWGHRLCPECQGRITWLVPPLCTRCGSPLDALRPTSHTCIHEPGLRAVRSAALFDGPMRDALHALKYRRDIGLAEVLAGLLLPVWQPLGWRAEVIIPIPLGARRARERGYNQAALIADAFGERIAAPVPEKWLVRSRETASQVGLSLVERHSNVAGAFSAQEVNRRTILLLDEVCTTGATLEAAAHALREAGAQTV
jgi:ComF family protein